MTAMNDFIFQNKDTMKMFIKKIATLPDAPPLEKKKIADKTVFFFFFFFFSFFFFFFFFPFFLSPI